MPASLLVDTGSDLVAIVPGPANDVTIGTKGSYTVTSSVGGGYGALTTRFGLATDSLIAAEVVLADGQLVTADESQNARTNTNVAGAQQLAFRNAHQVD